MRRARSIVVVAALALLAGTGTASAGSYDVDPARCEFGGDTPFELVTDPAMEVAASCVPYQVFVRSQKGAAVPFERAGAATLTAPDGTMFESIDWHGDYRRADCGWTVGVVADQAAMLTGARAFQDCDDLGQLFELRTNLSPTKTLSLRAECEEPSGCPAPKPDPDPFVPPHSAQVNLWDSLITMRDVVPPKLELVTWGNLPPQGAVGWPGAAGGRWVRGVQSVGYNATDGSGIRETSLTLSGHRERHVAACDYTRLAPCPQGSGELPVDTTRVADGVHPLMIEVLDAGSNPSTATLSARVDNTPPARVQPYVEGGSGWRRGNGFTIAWDAAAEPYAPITTAHYRLCRAGPNDCMRGWHGRSLSDFSALERLSNINVPGPGEWTLEVWREDEAGNVDEQFASPPVHLRFDDAPPAVAFDPRQLEDPRRISAVVTDRLSGVAGGEIQLRPAGGGPWQALPTRLDQGRLSAEVDDDRPPPGIYELRAVARDQAGNEGATHTLPDGSAALLRLPLRAQARLTAGIVKTRAKRKPRLLPSATVAFGQRLRLSGRLTNQLGRPEPGARLYVYSRSRVGRERFAGAVTTNRSGEFTYRLRARASGTIRIHYTGSRMLGKADREIALGVRAASVLEVNAHKVLNGDEVVFTGRLRGRPFPRPGKIIHLQAHYGREGWSNFGKPQRADSKGRWRIPWRFENTRGLVKYRFRVLVPEEASYPYETGTSNTVRVTVRGR